MHPHSTYFLWIPTELLHFMFCKNTSFPDICSITSVCKQFYRLREDVAKSIAIEQWGIPFWLKALSRPTLRKFSTMFEELKSMHRLEMCLKRNGLNMWSDRDFESFWKAEAAQLRKL